MWFYNNHIRARCRPGDLYTESGQTLEGSFSAVSTATIARVGAFFQIFRDLQDFHPFAPLWTQNFNEKLAKISSYFTEISQNFAKFRSNFAKFQRNFIGISPKFHRICRAIFEISRSSEIFGDFPDWYQFRQNLYALNVSLVSLVSLV